MPADWPELYGVSLGIGMQNLHQWVERHGVVVRDERWQTQTGKFLIAQEPLPARFNGWSELFGVPRVQVHSVRPQSGELTAPVTGGTVEIDGQRVPYGYEPPRFRSGGKGEVFWVIVFYDGETQTTVIGHDLPHIVTSWRRVGVESLVAARMPFFGIP